MLENSKAFSGFAVDDVDAAKEFYGETLGVATKALDDENGLLQLDLAGGSRPTLIYRKPDFEPATYTVLYFPVEDVGVAVDELNRRGVSFERYEEIEQDEKGISLDPSGPRVAWFKDPAGNILAVTELEA